MKQSSQPNILLFLSDQQRRDFLGAYGHNLVRTPHVDRLAQEGTRFDMAFTPSAICSPARTSLFTGLLPHQHGIITNCGKQFGDSGDLSEEIKISSQILSGAGYQCGYFGKWHIGRQQVPSQFGFLGHDFPGYGYPVVGIWKHLKFPLGWKGPPNAYADHLERRKLPIPEVLHAAVGSNPAMKGELYALQSGGPESSLSRFIADDAIDSIRHFARTGRPFFVVVADWGPHSPCIIPEPYFSMYAPELFEPWPNARDSLEAKPAVQKKYASMWGAFDMPWSKWQEFLARYAGYCTLIDDEVGRVVFAVKELGLMDNTMIVYTSDHGDTMGAHRLRDKGPFMYDEIYRIPLVIRFGKRTQVVEEFVMLQDLFSTFLEAAGVQSGSKTDSRSLMPYLRGEKPLKIREEFVGEFHGLILPYVQRCIRTRDYKYIFNSQDHDELYNLANDPWELENLIANPVFTEKLKELKDRLTEKMVETNDWLLELWKILRHI